MITLTAFIYNVLLWILWVAAVNLSLERRLKLPVTLAVELAAFIPWFFICTWISMYSSLWKTAFGFGSILFMFFFLHRGKWYARVIFLSMLLVVIVASEMIAVLFAPAEITAAGSEIPFDYSVSIFVLTFVIELILQSILVLVWNGIKKGCGIGLSSFETIYLAGFPAMQVVLLVFLLPAFWQGGYESFPLAERGLLFGSIVVSNVLLFVMIRMTANNAVQEEELRVREQTAALEARHYASLEDTAERLNELKHSLSEKFSAIASELASKEAQGALALTNSLLSEPLFERRFPACANRVIADYLSHRADALASKGIPAEFTVCLPPSLSIPNPALISALGNLLDNAEEASETANEPFIRLEMDYQNPYVRIKTENRYLPLKKEPRLTYEKPERGLGSLILAELAEKYDGEFRTAAEQSTWRATILLKGTTDEITGTV